MNPSSKMLDRPLLQITSIIFLWGAIIFLSCGFYLSSSGMVLFAGKTV